MDEKPVDDVMAWNLLCDILTGLAHIHDHQYIHLDIKVWKNNDFQTAFDKFRAFHQNRLISKGKFSRSRRESLLFNVISDPWRNSQIAIEIRPG